jgi:hypothetical protein
MPEKLGPPAAADLKLEERNRASLAELLERHQATVIEVGLTDLDRRLARRREHARTRAAR